MSDDIPDYFTSKIAWPEPGDELFIYGKDWHNNACVNWTPDGMELYVRGYKLSADALVERVMNGGHDQDFLVFPIVFLYRQYLELRMKSLIRDGRALFDQPVEYPHGHEIDKFWAECKTVLEQVWPGQEAQAIQVIDSVIKQFCDIDPKSFTFRYPTDKKGNRYLPADMRYINLRNLAEVMEKTANFLDGAADGVAVQLDHKQDYEADLRSMAGDWQ